jgi:hypothetical protein
MNANKPSMNETTSTTHFRPIATATTTPTTKAPATPTNELFCSTGPRPRGISLTGIESTSPTEINAANQGHVLAQLRIMRAKLKSREGLKNDTSATTTEIALPVLELSESPCPGE